MVPINCPQQRFRVKRDNSGLNLARLKLEVEHYITEKKHEK